MAKSNISVDVHSLSVVWNCTYDRTPTGKPTIKESWLKVKIDGADGNLSEKFRLLADSPLQFKISTAERVSDAKSSNTYYPRGKECAQLFTILGNVAHHVDMEGFSAEKWAKRFPTTSQASYRLAEYIEETSVKPEPIPAIASPVPDETVLPIPTPEEINNRMAQEEIPVVANGKIKGRARKLV